MCNVRQSYLKILILTDILFARTLSCNPSMFSTCERSNKQLNIDRDHHREASTKEWSTKQQEALPKCTMLSGVSLQPTPSCYTSLPSSHVPVISCHPSRMSLQHLVCSSLLCPWHISHCTSCPLSQAYCLQISAMTTSFSAGSSVMSVPDLTPRCTLPNWSR